MRLLEDDDLPPEELPLLSWLLLLLPTLTGPTGLLLPAWKLSVIVLPVPDCCPDDYGLGFVLHAELSVPGPHPASNCCCCCCY